MLKILVKVLEKREQSTVYGTVPVLFEKVTIYILTKYSANYIIKTPIYRRFYLKYRCIVL